MRHNKLLLFLFICFAGCLRLQAQGEWLTHFEKSDGLETPRYAGTMDFLHRLAKASRKLNVLSFGVSPQGRPLVYAVYDKDGLTEPDRIRKSGRIILWVQACIHPGEPEGKDAMLMLLRDAVIHNRHKDLFDKVSVLFIPIVNVDGHERFGPYNRINQNGPKEMGWRTTAQNLNLNRDHLKADAPEMQAWLRLFNRWMPEFFIDTHTSDGADYQYVITYSLEIHGQMDAGLTAWQKDHYLPRMQNLMNEAGFPMFPYVSFRRWHDPRSGLIAGVSGPMFSQGYTAVLNRPGLLVETHMLKPYAPRVEGTRQIILSTLKVLNEQHSTLLTAIRQADEMTASPAIRQSPFPLRFKVDMMDSTMMLFKGVEYEHRKSELTGGDWFVYDNSKPVDMWLPMFDRSVVARHIRLPKAYVVPVEWTAVIERLQWHGILYHRLKSDSVIHVGQYRFRKADWSRTPYEGRHRIINMELEEFDGDVVYPAGSVVVPVEQARARLIIHMLEPEGNGSLLEWGFFNTIFEQKEYAESYLMETLAREMLDASAELREEYEKIKAADPAFSASQQLQLNWFYSKSPWWDSRLRVYPVGRLF
ncbi:MAG TPA: M14 family metallopeptidase [Bacteroidales bacterium]|nr:M14 family metallopeptidase [Bacteroidales bacterium]